LNLYVTVNDLLNELAQLYNDLDKETKFRRKYANLSQEKSKFSDFYSMFQRLFFYLEYYEKQLIVDLQNKIVYHLHAAWSSQLIQSESLNEIRSYLIHLNNEHRVMNDIKEKKFLNKVRRQVIFAEKRDSLNLYRKIEVITLIDHSKLHDAILTSVKETDLQTESCFICHKSDHFSRECSDQILRVNALKMTSLINLHRTLSQILIQKTNYLFQSHWRDRDHIFVQSNRNSIERKLFWKVISD